MRVVRSLLSTDAVADYIRQAYPLAEPLQAHLIAVGDNDIYLIQTPGWRGVCRLSSLRFQPGFSYRERLCELEWLRHLTARGIKMSAPLQRRDGQYLGTIEAPEAQREIALFTWAEGENEGFHESARRTELVGQRLAELHLASRSFRTELPRVVIDSRRLLDVSLERISGHLQTLGLQREWDALRALAEPLQRRLEPLPRDDSAFGFIHGDFNGENHHITDDGQVVFFDTELSGPGWFLYDPAVMLSSMRRAAVPLSGIVETGARLLAGYQTVRPLHEWEWEALDALILARHFWIMGEHVVDIPSLGVLRVGPPYWRNTLTRMQEWQKTPMVPSIRERLSRQDVASGPRP